MPKYIVNVKAEISQDVEVEAANLEIARDNAIDLFKEDILDACDLEIRTRWVTELMEINNG